MITAVSIHAIERMNQRFGTKNILKHIRKRRFLPADGVTLVKGVDYITRGVY